MMFALPLALAGIVLIKTLEVIANHGAPAAPRATKLATHHAS